MTNSIISDYKYKTGFALSGGGARGFAHLGAIQALKEHHITPDIMSGVSAGALAGVFIADGYEPAEIMEIFNEMTFREFTELSLPNHGLFKTSRLEAFVKKYIKATNFEDLKIPLIVTTADFDNGVSVNFCEGPLVTPVVASCSFPIVFSPTLIDGVQYVDGGLFKNFPVSVIREQCEKVVGINVSPVSTKYAKDTLRGVIDKCVQFLLDATTIQDTPLCDLLIKPLEIRKYSIFDVKASKEIYDIGYQAALEVLREQKIMEKGNDAVSFKEPLKTDK